MKKGIIAALDMMTSNYTQSYYFITNKHLTFNFIQSALHHQIHQKDLHFDRIPFCMLSLDPELI